MLKPLLSHLAVNRLGPGRPRTRPDAVIGDKAYSSRAIRSELRSRGVKAVIPQPSDQIAHRKRRGSAGGRPPAFDAVIYKGRNVIERSFNDHKQWRGLATRYDKLAVVYRGGVVLAPSPSGFANKETRPRCQAFNLVIDDPRDGHRRRVSLTEAATRGHPPHWHSRNAFRDKRGRAALSAS
jgi:transposase